MPGVLRDLLFSTRVSSTDDEETSLGVREVLGRCILPLVVVSLADPYVPDVVRTRLGEGGSEGRGGK